jgi:thiol:disulfide interchange protein
MKKLSLTVATLLVALTGSAFAQDSTGVTVSRDPAKAAAVEQRAAEIKANPQTTSESKPATSTTHAKKHHVKKHAKHVAKKKAVTGTGNKSATPVPASATQATSK